MGKSADCCTTYRVSSAFWCFPSSRREKRKRIGRFDAVAPRLPAAPKRRISSLSRARARLIDRATYVDMCRDTYRKLCTHTAQPCSPNGRCASTTGSLNESPGMPGPFFPSPAPSSLKISRFLSSRESPLPRSVAVLATDYKRGLLSDESVAVTTVGRSRARNDSSCPRDCFVIKRSVCPLRCANLSTFNSEDLLGP